MGRKKRDTTRARPHRDAGLFLIATEGEKTEPAYFTALETDHLRVKVHVIPSDSGKTSPRHVLENLESTMSRLDFGEGDVGWLVIDRDVQCWTASMLSEVSSRLLDKGLEMAMSNPCFEIWLLYHHELPESSIRTSSELCARLREVLGSYSKANLDTAQFLTSECIDRAMTHAKSEDTDPQARWPNQRTSRVYRLMEQLLPFLVSDGPE